MDETVRRGMDRPLAQPKWRRQWTVAAITIGVLALAVFAIVRTRAERSLRVDASAVKTAVIERGVFHDATMLRATAVPHDVVILDAQEGGRVERVHVEAGDTLVAGQPIVEFGNTELQLEVIEREARLIEQINNLRGAEIALEQTRSANERALEDIDYNITRLRRLGNRVNTLASTGATPMQDRDSLADELVHYERLRPIVVESNQRQDVLRVNRLPEIHDALEKLRLNLQIVRAKLDGLVVRAPVAGRLTNVDLKVGQNRERGSHLAEIVPDTGFKLEADVDEYYLGRVHNGQRAEVEFESAKYALQVTRVYPQVKEGHFKIDLTFVDRQPADILSGQSAQGALQLGSDRLAVVMPAGAFLEQTGGRWVYVVDKDGKSAARRTIEVGRRSPEQIEILRGLTPGERVIVSSYRGMDAIGRLDLSH